MPAREVSVQAGSQFVGSEFTFSDLIAVGALARVLEIDLHLGPGLKEWKIEKVTGRGGRYMIAQSQAGGGQAGPAADTDVVLVGPDVQVLLEQLDTISITTRGATSHMTAKVYLQ